MIQRRLVHRIAETLGCADGEEPIQSPGAKNLQEHFNCTSLEIVSVQLSIEEEFGLKFATGASDRGPIDERWDACKSIDDLVALVLDFKEKT